MKRVIFILTALVLSAVVSDVAAQQVVKKRIGVYKEGGDVVVAEAVTTLAVDITVEHEVFVAGPYARYAQKLLGKRASFVDRDQYTIVSADVAVLSHDAYVASDACPVSEEVVVSEELPLQIDRMSAVEKSPEVAASAAAEQIIALRRARLELITGEMGDGVFGAGLESALAEIGRLEQAYLELFYGKSSVTRSSQRVLLPVSESNKTYVVARFNPNSGIVAKDDLTGELVMLSILPSECEYPAGDAKGVVAYRYANNAEVSLTLGQELITRRVLPIYEFGKTVMYLLPR
uniref:DUF4831 family protein n=1 Tax=Alistipes sp. TaxID=1872444 RepID=UPI004055D6E8